MSALAGEANEVETLLAGLRPNWRLSAIHAGGQSSSIRSWPAGLSWHSETEQATNLVSELSQGWQARAAVEEFSQLDSRIAGENLVKAASEPTTHDISLTNRRLAVI